MAAFPMVPFWSVFERVPKRTGYGSEELLSVYRNFGVIRKADRDDNNNRPGQSLDDYQLVEPHNLVFNKMKAWQGSLGISAYRGIVSPAYFVYRPVSDFNGRYMHHLLRCTKSIDFYAANSKGIRVNQWDLEPEQLNQMKIPLPDLDTQRRIANYLDAETAQIDTLVAELDEYVELLEKRRRAVIDSYFDQAYGTGSVPLRLVADITPGYAFSSQTFDSENTGCLLVRGVNVKPSRLDWLDSVRLDSNLKPPSGYEVVSGDILLGMDRPLISTGVRAVRITEIEEGAQLVQRVLRLRTESTDLQEIIYFALNSSSFKDTITPDFTGISVPHLSAEQVATFRVPTACIENASIVARELKETDTQTDTIITQCRELKELLLKRRQVLITDVVTGKVEV